MADDGAAVSLSRSTVQPLRENIANAKVGVVLYK